MDLQRLQEAPLPHDAEAERMLLGALFLATPKQALPAFQRLRGADFFNTTFGELFEVGRRIYFSRRGWACPKRVFRTLREWSKEPEALREVARLWFHKGMVDAGDPRRIEEYVGRVEHVAGERREVLRLYEELRRRLA